MLGDTKSFSLRYADWDHPENNIYHVTEVFEVDRRRGGEPLRHRDVAKLWGSCTRAGRLLLNTELAHVPVSCIDYVMAYEFCHLKYPNHSPAFYALLTQAMPDWRQRKARLETAVL